MNKLLFNKSISLLFFIINVEKFFPKLISTYYIFLYIHQIWNKIIKFYLN